MTDRKPSSKPSNKGKKKKDAETSSVAAKVGSENAGSSDSPSAWKRPTRLGVILPIAIGAFAVALSWPDLLNDLLPSSLTPLLPSFKGSTRTPDGQGLPHSYIVCSAEGEKGIYTVDERNRVVDCIGVEGEWIVGSGTLDQVQQSLSSSPKPLWQRWWSHAETEWPVYRIAPGSIVIPGMSDSHCHILEYGAGRQIPLGEGKSVEDTVGLIAAYILAHEDVERAKEEVVVGWGWNHENWEVVRLPTAADLDANPVTRNRPIILQSKDGHAIWVSQTLIDKHAPYPDTIEGGVIVRGTDGKPSGVFIDSAQSLIPIPPVSLAEQSRRFQVTVKDALRHGLTSLHDAGYKNESMGLFLSEVNKNGRLPIRVYAMAHFDEEHPDAGLDSGKLRRLEGMSRKQRLTVRSLKVFADGALRTGGAALYEPYEDNPTSSGSLRLPPETIHRVIGKYMKRGWQVNVHAIGDRANGVVLDAFEDALKDLGCLESTDGTKETRRRKNAAGCEDLRPRLEHAQMMTTEDVKRVGRLGVIASIQPAHVISDMIYAESRVGPHRTHRLYAFQSLLSKCARLAMGTDFPVEGVDPLVGFWAGTTRRSLESREGEGDGGWFPNQRLTRTQALRALTIDAAYASFNERFLGSLESGKKADFVVLGLDVMKVEDEKLREAVLRGASGEGEGLVKATVLDGGLVFGDLDDC